MNDKIFEKLKYHSGLVAQGCWDELDDYDREAIRRFGDMIVRECAMHMDQYADRTGNDLLEHFGVEL